MPPLPRCVNIFSNRKIVIRLPDTDRMENYIAKANNGGIERVLL